MNKYQEALSTLVKYAHQSPNVGWALIYEENILQELIDKETPMKPKEDASNHYYCGKCLDCITFDPNISLNRCGSVDCGQVVDWSKDNE